MTALLRTCMTSTAPLSERLRTAAQQLNGKIEAGNLRRLPMCELVELRGLVWMLEAASVEAENPAPVPRRSWLRRVWG